MNFDIKKIFGHLTSFALVAAALISAAAPAYSKPKEKLWNRPYADQKRWHLGFSVGLSVQDLAFTHNGTTFDGEQWYVETPSLAPGINVNVLADLRLHEHFNLRFSPGMSFGFKDVEIREYTSGLTYRQDVKSVYVLLPLDLKISGKRYQNSRPYVTAGVMGGFDVGKKRSDYLMFNTADAYLTVGMGCDFYLPFFKFNPEIKFCFGLTNILKKSRPDLEDDPQMAKITQSLSQVKSNMFILTFYFE